MHPFVYLVRVRANSNEKEKEDAPIGFPCFLMVFDGLSMSFPLHVPALVQVLPPPSHPAWALPRLWLQPGRIWSLHAFNIVQRVPNRSKPGDGLGLSWSSFWSLGLLCVCFCASLWMFGFFWIVFDDACFGMLLGCQKSCQQSAARWFEAEESNFYILSLVEKS